MIKALKAIELSNNHKRVQVYTSDTTCTIRTDKWLNTKL